MWLGEHVEAYDCGDDVASWLSTYLDKPRMRLIYNATGMTKRKLTDRELEGMRHTTASAEDQIAFSDVSPYMILSQPSVDELNTRLDTPVKARNFRANIIISKCNAFAEDSWDEVQIGKAKLRGTWPCPRCIFVTINPETGIKDSAEQPLATLNKYRILTEGTVCERLSKKPMFGRYFLIEDEDIISVGDKIGAVSKKPQYM